LSLPAGAVKRQPAGIVFTCVTLASMVLATAMWLAGYHTPVLYQNG